uniref:Ribonuclease H-like domain-containing protein n=1 Tax=Tanacetum cinerariifolium TaxID=118510 RepID=A0A6L2NVM1_TANCI|nr:ribonuclease H-like domain-containing protein [Tanacetum cinerariifolium]
MLLKVLRLQLLLQQQNKKAQRRLELKETSTLLMGILNERQLKFNPIKDAKSLLQAVEKRFEGNVATKKTQRNLLKQQYENFTASSSEVLDQNFDRFKKLISQLEIHGESISQKDVNKKFLRREANRLGFILDVLKCLKGSYSLISLVTKRIIYCLFEVEIEFHRRFLKNTRSKFSMNGNETIGFDKSKVECYNCHKRGHFARECRAPRSQDTKHKEGTRRTVPVETSASSTLVSCDRLGELMRKLELAQKQKDKIQQTIEKFKNLSKNLSKLIDCQIVDKCKRGLGYNVVPPRYTRNFMPPKPDLSGLEEFVNKPIVSEPTVKKPIIEPSEAKASADKPKVGNPQQDLQNKGVNYSGCSRHMTGNMSYLTDDEEINRGYVAFGGKPKGGKITSKGTIKTGKLDFENVYFVRELEFNLFSVSQICDKKNSVLFNDTKCIVLSPNFKLTDESHVLLKVPRKNNMYSVDLNNIVPKEGLTCLFTKATSDESKLWHRRRSKEIVKPGLRTIIKTPVATMEDTRTMSKLLQAPTQGYEDAIVIPAILAENFKLKITSTLKYKNFPHDAIKLMLFPFSLEGEAWTWLEKEPPRSIHTWEDLVSKFVDYFFPHSKTTNLKNDITNFQQMFDETFCEAWDRFKDLLPDGNLLNRTPRDALMIIKNKSKARTLRNKLIISKVSTTTSSPSPSSDVTALTKIVKELVLMNNASQQATVKAIEEICVTYGGPHTYYEYLATSGNTFNACAAVRPYNQGGNGYRPQGDPNYCGSNQMGPPGFPPPNVQNSQNYNQNRPSGSGSLPSNTVANPRCNVKAIITQSGVAYEGPSILPTSSSLPKEVEREPEVTKDKVQPTCSESTAHVQPPVVQLPILEADVAPKPNSKSMEEAFALETYSYSHDSRARKPIGPTTFLFDLLRLTRMARALIDVNGKELTLRVNDEAITFKVGHTSRYSRNYYEESVNQINVIDVTCEEYAQEVLGFSNSLTSGNPTPSDPIIASSSPSFTLFEG